MTTKLPPRRPRRIGTFSPGDGGGDPPKSPIARAIEALYSVGATPRLMIDSRRADVVVPDFLRAKWAEKLVIDLKASDPLDLAYDDETGVSMTLAFSGYVTRCTFSWASIYAIVDRNNSQRVIVIPAHEPPAQLPPELAYDTAEPKPVTEVVDAKAKPKLAAVQSAPSAPSASEPKTESVGDAEAKARRAKFRVIEGG